MKSLDIAYVTAAKKPGKFSNLLVKFIKVSLLVLACLVGTACLAVNQFGEDFNLVAQTVSELADQQPIHNQIAFVGNDDNVWVVGPDGKGLRRITTDGKQYRFPTWSPDSRRLAFIGSNDENIPVLYVSPAAKSIPTVLFDNPTAAPFYLYWSPDSNAITFLTQEISGLVMRQANANDPGMSRVLGEGAPFYWVWSPRSDQLLMHVGGSRAFSDEAHLSLLSNQEDAERVELDLAPGSFQAPVWSSDGQYIFYIASDEGGQEAIYRTDTETSEEKLLTRLRGFAYMVLPLDNQHIAYLQIERGDRPPFGTAYIMDIDGENKQRLMDNPVGSIFWSPDGTKLALLSLGRRSEGPTARSGGLAAPLPQQQELIFRWWVYDINSEELEVLTSFVPTTDFLQIVPYFDQYHLSLTFWSPDSRYFVVTKEDPNNKGEGAVWIIDSTGQEDPFQVGEGTLAVWSWQ